MALSSFLESASQKSTAEQQSISTIRALPVESVARSAILQSEPSGELLLGDCGCGFRDPLPFCWEFALNEGLGRTDSVEQSRGLVTCL